MKSTTYLTYSQNLSNLSPQLVEMEPLLLPVSVKHDRKTNSQKISFGKYMLENNSSLFAHLCGCSTMLPDYSRRDHLSRFGPLHHRTPRILPELGINQNQKQSKTLERLTHLLLLMPITTPTAMDQLNRCCVGSK